jgi:hypothetical protein
MADTTFYPYEMCFESGDLLEATSEVDTQSKLSCDHYKRIVEQLGLYPAALPYKGAYCAHVDLSLGIADAYVQEDTGFDAALASPRAVRVYFQATSNLTMAPGDYFTIFALQSTGGTDEAVIGVVNNAGAYQLVFAETATLAAAQGAATRSAGLTLNAWHCLELVCAIDAAAGTLAAYLDGYQVGTTITGLAQGAITQARLGVIGQDAGTTQGHLLFDALISSTTRIGPLQYRYGQTVNITKSGFVALGPGCLRDYALIPGAGTDCHMTLYDLDAQPVLAGSEPLGPPLGNFANFTVEKYHRRLYFQNGLYAAINGTAPRAMVTLHEANLSDATIRKHALTRR